MADQARDWSIGAARALAVDDGAHAVIDELLARIAAAPDDGVWIQRPTDAELRARAASVDALATETEELPLRGVPFAVKDNIDVAGVPTTAGCRDFAYVPEESAPVVQALLDAGAIFAGKTNLDQFATGLVGTRSPHFGTCRHPGDPRYIAGGSSSGSAVAVATGCVPIALGTDTAGSGRVPAACCGVVGVKPTPGRLSTRGVVPASPTFDCVSLLTTSCGDGLAVLDVLDPSIGAGEPWAAQWRLGVPKELEWFGDTDAAQCFAAAVERLDAIADALVPFELAPFRAAGDLLYGSALVAERNAAFGGFVDAHPAATDPAVRQIVANAADHSATETFAAFHDLARLRSATQASWRDFDVLVVPTVARHPRVDEVLADPFTPNRELGTYTNFVNPLGLSAVAVPAGRRACGLPFGISLIGPSGADAGLLVLAAAFAGEPAIEARVPPCTLVVVGAHLSGQPLNHELIELGGRLLRSTATSAAYRLFALDTSPPKPGLIREPAGGAAIEVEVWGLGEAAFGAFVARIPTPLSVGTVELADGTSAPGFLCESYALSDATEITSCGGWRAYLATASI